MLCPWWLRRAGQCCLQLLILKPLPLAYFFFPSPNTYMCKRCHQPGTITWISALIAWLTFANGVCGNNYMARITTATRTEERSFLLWIIAAILQASQKFVVCRCATEDKISKGRTIYLVEATPSTWDQRYWASSAPFQAEESIWGSTPPDLSGNFSFLMQERSTQETGTDVRKRGEELVFVKARREGRIYIVR